MNYMIIFLTLAMFPCQRSSRERYYQSARHTIQRDPIVYNDEIADLIGAKPSPFKFPDLAWR